jgi:pimeloyl-ACP methyl ester carboxylesterase
MNAVFFRGFARESAHWGNFIPKFQAVFPHVRILCMDTPGNGIHYEESSPLTIGETVDRCRAELLKRHPDLFESGAAPTFVFGISLGGMIAIDWMCRYPNELQAGIVVSTSLSGFSSVQERLSLNGMKKVLQIFVSKNQDARNQHTLEMISSNPASHQDILGDWKRISDARPISAANAIRQLIAASRYRSPKKPQQPLLILSSRGDRMVNPKCSDRIAETWKLEHHVHPTAGHDIPLDDPDWVIQQSKDWLSKLKLGNAAEARP